MAGMDYLVVLCTVADEEAGRALAHTLVKEGLAACVQLIPGRAVYRWRGELHDESQIQLIIKTRSGAWPALSERVSALHKDELPDELLALDVTDGLAEYLEWVDESVTGGQKWV